MSELGLEGSTLTAANYHCVGSECSREPSDDDSAGCLTVIPTTDPALADGSQPELPAEWYSVTWRGRLGEYYSAPPERVTEDPQVEFEPAAELTCAINIFGIWERTTTAAEAAQMLEDAGVEGTWRQSANDTCPAAESCPIPGVPDHFEGCFTAFATTHPPDLPGPGATAEFAFGFFSAAGDRSLIVSAEMAGVNAQFEPSRVDGCPTLNSPPRDRPYMPHTDVIEPTEWRLTAPPAGATLDLQVAVGGGCSSFERIDVTENDDVVTVTALSRDSNPAPYSACDDILLLEDTTVELSAPLGDRRLEGCDPIPDIQYLDVDADNCASAN